VTRDLFRLDIVVPMAPQYAGNGRFDLLRRNLVTARLRRELRP